MHHSSDPAPPAATSPPALPLRPVLCPGSHVLRRSASELQVGLDPSTAVVLPDEPAVAATLAALSAPAALPPPDAQDATTLALLRDGGHLLDADELLPLVPAGLGAPPPAERSDAAALARTYGDAAGTLARSRRGKPVEVVAAGDALARDCAERLARLLTGSGTHPHLSTADAPPLPPTAATGRQRVDPRAGVGVLLSVGEPHREHVDGWMRDGLPHVLLRFTEGSAILGPFVVPGQSPCLRCLDAHHTDHDPAWPLLVRQYAAACSRSRDDTVPEPVDHLLAALAVAWVAREVVSFLDGECPVTSGTTLRLDARLTRLETQGWPRHPGCGCSWE